MKRFIERTVIACALVAVAGVAQGFDGSGLVVKLDAQDWPRWQGRLSLGTYTASREAPGASPGQQGPVTFSLMSDYYLTGSLFGPSRGGGFRATSGVMIGPRSQAWAGPAPGFKGSTFNVDRRVFGQAPNTLPGDATQDAPTVPYLGVGYTGLAPRGGWSFSADLGLMSTVPGSVKLGRVSTGNQGLDDAVRDMRWSPVLQLGVSYLF